MSPEIYPIRKDAQPEFSNRVYLVDTTVWVKFLRGIEPSLKEKLSSLVLEGKAFTTEIIIMEILRGAKSDKEYNSLYEDLTALPQLSLDSHVWEIAWKVGYNLRKAGVNVPMTDILIASIAVRHKAILMHSDKHFKLITKHTTFKAVEI